MKKIFFSFMFLLFASFFFVGCQLQKHRSASSSDRSRTSTRQVQVQNTLPTPTMTPDTKVLTTPPPIKQASDVDKVINNTDKALNDLSSDQLNLNF